jgi:hypothetical protein
VLVGETSKDSIALALTVKRKLAVFETDEEGVIDAEDEMEPVTEGVLLVVVETEIVPVVVDEALAPSEREGEGVPERETVLERVAERFGVADVESDSDGDTDGLRVTLMVELLESARDLDAR